MQKYKKIIQIQHCGFYIIHFSNDASGELLESIYIYIYIYICIYIYIYIYIYKYI